MKVRRQYFLFAISVWLISSNSRLYSQAEFSFYHQSHNISFFDIDAVNTASENNNLSRLDLYIKITYDNLQFIKSQDGNFLAAYEVSVDVFDEAGERVDGKIWQEDAIANNFDETYSRRLFGLSRVSFDLSPNEYQISVGLQDLETLRTGHQKSSIILRDYSKDEISVSDISFLDYLAFGKNGELHLRAKVSGESHEESKLYAYFEIYNIPESDSVYILYEILGSENKVIQKSEYWKKSEGGVTHDSIEIDKDLLSHGKYRAKISISLNENTIRVERPFASYWEGMPASFSDVKEAIAELKYIASKDELKKIKKADKEDQRKEFIKFWQLRDPTPGTYENEFMEEYYRRIRFANENFSGFRDGWKTDMGMSYVKLGPPDSIERNPFNQGLSAGVTVKAYEVWSYFQYNVQLIFIDKNGFGEYRLANPNALYDINFL